VKLYHTDYLVTLRVTTHDSDPPPAIVLRSALKTLLRCFHIQCRDVAEASSDPGPGDQGAAPGHAP
jgi:hypothetical protein